jgi:DNA-binding response OmpR family regulator
MNIYNQSTEHAGDAVLTTRGVRALVIDDDRYVLSLLCDLLGSWGYEVDGVGSPAEGLRRFEDRPYDVVVTDLTMPGVSGIEVVTRIRAHNDTVGVIVFTAATSDLDEARERLRFTLLRKPLEIEALRRAVREALPAHTV